MTTSVGVARWWADAVCAQVGLEYFFAEDDTEDDSEDDAPRSTRSTRFVAEARRICMSCPVISECRESLVLEARQGHRDLFGYRAGMSSRQQRAFVRQRIFHE